MERLDDGQGFGLNLQVVVHKGGVTQPAAEGLGRGDNPALTDAIGGIPAALSGQRRVSWKVEWILSGRLREGDGQFSGGFDRSIDLFCSSSVGGSSMTLMGEFIW